MNLRDRFPQTLPQEAARGLALAFGVVTLGVWGMLGYGWYLGPTHQLQRTAAAHVQPPGLTPPTRAAALPPVARPAVTTPVLADPARRPDLEAAAPAPEPVSVTPIKRVPESHSLLVSDADGKQLAPDAGLEDAADLPAGASEAPHRATPAQQAGIAPMMHPSQAVARKAVQATALAEAKEAAAAAKEAAKPAPVQPAVAFKSPMAVPAAVAAKPAVAVAAVVPAAVVPAAEPAAEAPDLDFPVAAPVLHPRYTSVYNRRLHRRRWVLAAKPTHGLLSSEERPAHDLTAAAPMDPRRHVPIVRPQELSPGAQAEMAASQREEQPARGVPDAAAPVGAQAALPMARSPQTLIAHAPHAGALPRQRLALRRQQLPLSARMATRPAALAAAPKQPNSGITLNPVVVGGANLGEPVYDAAHHTLRVPVEGRLPDGELHVYRLDSGRAYVDVAGARPSSGRTKVVATQDGVFQHGAIAARPEAGGTRLSFDLGRNGDLAASVEGGQVVLKAVTRSKKDRVKAGG
ncbi:MAG: hypothetical protein JWM80_3756 [Cyanobacteria bacterium RYN_339]|nr:hypothetical protein [Cyanobacteria bacterium RYN_339]